MFAKLYGTDTDQVLVKLDHNDEEDAPELRIYFQPPDLGVCFAALRWTDNSDESWDLAEEAFAKMDEEAARKIVNEQLALLQ